MSVKLLKDLKELHHRLNQNPKNSSRPSSSMAAWEKNDDANKNETIEDSTVDIKSASEPKSEKIINDKKENEEVSPELNAAQGLLNLSTLKNDNVDKPPPKKPGKQTGSVGVGRSWNPEITDMAVHCFVESCVVCNHILEIEQQRCYTQYKQVDIQLGEGFNPGLRVIVTPYFLCELQCSYCDHVNRYDPKSTVAMENSVWEKIPFYEELK